MRIYDEISCELFYLSVYARMRLVPGGMVIAHTLTLEEILLRASRKDTARLWKLLEEGAPQQQLSNVLAALDNGNEKLFAVLIGKGMIE